MTETSTRAGAVKCLCPSCSAEPCFRFTEAWRRECEARYVLSKKKDARQAYYAGVEKFRGKPATQQLIDDVRREYAHANARNQPARV